MMLIAFGFSFEMPVFAYFFGSMGILTSTFMAKGRRYSVVSILIIAAILTPADVFSQVMLAGPLYILYEISILLVKSIERKRKKKKALEQEEFDREFPDW